MRPIMNPTSVERKLMEEMDRRGLKYVFQHSVPGGFHVDFAFPEKMVAVECDGDYWHGNPRKYKKGELNRVQVRNIEVDRERAQIITTAGWKIIRFWEAAIEKDVEKCVNLIEKNLKSAKIRMADGVMDGFY